MRYFFFYLHVCCFGNNRYFYFIVIVDVFCQQYFSTSRCWFGESGCSTLSCPKIGLRHFLFSIIFFYFLLLVRRTNAMCCSAYRCGNISNIVTNRKERNGITRKERRERSLCVTLRKNFAHFAVKKISLFLIIVVGLENQWYLLFGISLSEHIKQLRDGLYYRQSLRRTYRLRRQSLRRVRVFALLCEKTLRTLR